MDGGQQWGSEHVQRGAKHAWRKNKGLSVHRRVVRDIMVEPIGTEQPQKGQGDLSIDGGQQRECEV